MSISDDAQKNLRVLASYVPKLLLKKFQLSATPVNPPSIEMATAAVLFADISGAKLCLTKISRTDALGLRAIYESRNELDSTELLGLWNPTLSRWHNAVFWLEGDQSPTLSRYFFSSFLLFVYFLIRAVCTFCSVRERCVQTRLRRRLFVSSSTTLFPSDIFSF